MAQHETEPLANPARFWRTAARMALRHAYELLFDKASRVMVAVLLFCIYAVLLWKYAHLEARQEIFLHVMATVAPLLIFPAVWAAALFWNASRIYRECYDKYQAVIAGAPEISVELFNDKNVTLCQILNKGAYFTLSPEIDFSNTRLSEQMHVHVDPQWLDGYAGGYRIFKEGSKNTFRLREISITPNYVQEIFYGSLGSKEQMWVENTTKPVTRRVRILFNSSPQFIGGHKELVLEFIGDAISLLSGEGIIRPTIR